MRLAALFAILAFDATPIASAGPESEESLPFVFQPPMAPGDAFSLAFPVPSGHLAAVLFVDGAVQPDADPALPPTAAQLSSGLFFPVPIASDAPTAVLCGVVPSTMTPEQLQTSMVAMRVLLVDTVTMHFWWSDPITLKATTPDSLEPDGTVDDSAVLAPTLVVDATALPSDELASESAESTPDALNFATTAGPPPASQHKILASNADSLTAGANWNMATGSRTVVMRTTGPGHFYNGSNDQPVPVQGSGH